MMNINNPKTATASKISKSRVIAYVLCLAMVIGGMTTAFAQGGLLPEFSGGGAR